MMLGFSNRQEFINADAKGYYDYLPSAFLHKDLDRFPKSTQDFPETYHRIETLFDNYNQIDGFKVNKYTCGTAIFVFPFFYPLQQFRMLQGYVDSGYELPYQVIVLIAALTWFLIGLFYIRKTLLLHSIDRLSIFLCQFAIVFATPFTHYAWFDAGYSHVFSFAAISIFVYSVSAFLKGSSFKYFTAASLFFGLIIILRPINLLVLFAIPLLIEKSTLNGFSIKMLKTKWKLVLLSLFIMLMPAILQSILWYIQTGKFILYSYQNEFFDFLNPQLVNIWFSYQKGLFIYTPILLLFFVLTLSQNFSKNAFFSLYFISYFIAISYIFSAWWSWFYGSSYGQRVFLDYLPILILPIKLIQHKGKQIYRLLLGLILTLTIGLNLLQTWQYQHYILHWDQMNKSKYWLVFLRTSNPYMGWVWKEKSGEPKTKYYSPHKEINYKSNGLFADTILTTQGIHWKALENNGEMRLSLSHHFPHEFKGEIAVFAIDTITQEKLFWEQKQLLQFCNGTPGTLQIGDYWFKPKPQKPLESTKCYIVVYKLDKTDSLIKLKTQIVPSFQ